MTQQGVNYNPEWPIRVNVDHILGDEENLSRLPPDIRRARNLILFLETAVELARRKAFREPGIVVPQGNLSRPILHCIYFSAIIVNVKDLLNFFGRRCDRFHGQVMIREVDDRG